MEGDSTGYKSPKESSSHKRNKKEPENRNSSSNEENKDKKEDKVEEEYLRELDLAVEASKGRNLNLKDDPKYLERLRIEARRAYLEQRELDRLQLEKRVLEEKEILFGNKRVSREKGLERDEFIQRALKLDRDKVKLAEGAIESRPTEAAVISYELPDSYDEDNLKRLEVLKKKQQGKAKDKVVNEQELWENKLYKYGTSKFGVTQAEEKREGTKLIDVARKEGRVFKDEVLGDLTEFKDLVSDSVDFVLDSTLPELKLSDVSHITQGYEEEHEGISCLLMVCADDSEDGTSSEDGSDMENRKKKTSNNFLRRLRRLERKQHKMMLMERQKLPIYLYRNELLAAIKKYKTVIVVGETGSGKTTQIPQYLHEVGYSKAGMIGVTQPRRVAAMSVAARVSKELNVKLGSKVGYSIRFEDYTSSSTLIKFMTDGMLLREFMGDPTLSKYCCLMIDEAHERTLHTDVIFGLVKDLVRYRSDFRLIISSATLEAEKFALYFDHAPIFKIPGRRYPVQIYYTKTPEANYLDASIITVLQIHLTQPLGDILVFLPGQQEIEYIQEELTQRLKNRKDIRELIILTIYSSLPSDMQSKIFEPTPAGARKVVLSTNISETSITLDNIVYVIDSGFCKLNSYSPKTGLDSLVTLPCSKANANQRTGRAGRIRAGHCFRLYTKFSYDKEMDDNHDPEITRVNLSSVVLLLKSIGIDDLLNFDFMDPPSPETLITSLELIYSLGALNDKGDLTKLGKTMSELPLDPMYAKTLLTSIKNNCYDEIIVIISMLSIGNNVFYVPKDRKIHADNCHKNFYTGNSDHLMLLNVYNQWKESEFSMSWCYENYVQYKSLIQSQNIIEQLKQLVTRLNLLPADGASGSEANGVKTNDGGSSSNSAEMNLKELMLKSIVSGFFVNVAIRSSLKNEKNFRTIKTKQLVEIHPQSSLFNQQAKYVVFNDLVLTTKQFMRQVSEIQSKWLMELAPHFYQNIQLPKQ
ncbi:DEAD-box family helicase [Theileria orientalis strain Shintoku]|uniref:RNA helicase n=1 Tax=Theileria orientalis strain Shintoku TaxID=869250 RepID=J4C2R0_THEOR|nr:DEAD-box family helicase [Theileria orientalis strain Shintoku]BAM39126.1 DEAD-box family helicase [Theileria orientalis strain Shintoku]|eukprot:XP_009689427.1 DEAD-box family helicase [Theileria orientalis strain Shintoku]